MDRKETTGPKGLPPTERRFENTPAYRAECRAFFQNGPTVTLIDGRTGMVTDYRPPDPRSQEHHFNPEIHIRLEGDTSATIFTLSDIEGWQGPVSSNLRKKEKGE